MEDSSNECESTGPSGNNLRDNNRAIKETQPKPRLPFIDWFHQLWPKPWQQQEGLSKKGMKEDPKQNPFLPKITMVGISTEESGQMSKATVKKTMDDLTQELEKAEVAVLSGGDSSEDKVEDRDPLFVANVGDYYSGIARTGSPRWVRGRTIAPSRK